MSSKLQISEMFNSIQGEGFHSGELCTFVRLWGCNARGKELECSRWCDTQYAWEDRRLVQQEPEEWLPDDLFDHLSIGCLPIVFTGGEPLLQLRPLWDHVARLARDKPVRVETNGTLDTPFASPVWVTCSPKPPKYEIAPLHVDEIKLVVTWDLLRRLTELCDTTSSLNKYYPDIPRYLQPCDNDIDLARKIVLAMRFDPSNLGTWRLGLQLHKVLNVR